MIDKSKTDSYNKYLITIFLGIIVFMNTEVIGNINLQTEQLVLAGVNFVSSLLLIATLLLLFATAPKSLVLLKIFRRKKIKDTTFFDEKMKLSKDIDVWISVSVWCFLFIITFTSSIIALFM